MTDTRLYGTVAEYGTPDDLLKAARAAREKGYRKMEAYSPYPIKELDEIMPSFRIVPALVLAGGLLGAATAWIMQYYIAAIDFPTNVGGRPLYSWPAFIVITFELTILFAGCTAFFGSIFLCGLPAPYHTLFQIARFRDASSNRLFLCIEAKDPRYVPDVAAELLRSFDPIEVWELELP